MVNAAGVTRGQRGGWWGVMLLAAVVLTAAAWLRGAEYDEQYTLFLTAGTARPAWPDAVFLASTVTQAQRGHASLTALGHDLRSTDVHPPLYFWAVSLWRRVAGWQLFAARLFSVLCGLISLAAVGRIARHSGIRPLPAMALTLGSYGFAYTSVIARGFAPALVLILYGVAVLTGTRRWQGQLAAGALFGAACCCNYLSVFVAVAAGVAAGAWLMVPAAAPFLALDAWFLSTQHGSRTGQFVPFDLLSALPRLIAYQVANLFGGLPLYVDGTARILVGVAVAAVGFGLLAAVLRARPWSHGPVVRLLLSAAIAPAAGLLLLGAAFDNTPIELRYLAFGIPFLALLAAWACGPQPSADGRTPGAGPRWARGLLLIAGAVQVVSVIGLMVASRTMQPAEATARAAAGLAQGGVVLLPRGNDGVGIVGVFGQAAPAALPLLLVRPTDPPALLRARVAGYHRVVLALIAQDRDSVASMPLMRAAFAAPGWRLVAAGSNVEAYQQVIEDN